MAEFMDIKLQKKRAEYQEIMREEKESQEREVICEGNNSILNGSILLNGEQVNFSERTILENRASIWMPADFKEMTKEEIGSIYYLGNQPQAVLVGGSVPIHLGFNHTQHTVSDANLKEFVDTMQKIVETVGPKVSVYGTGARRIGDHPLLFMEMVSHTLEDAIYNLIFFCVLDNRVLIGFLNCTYSFLDSCRPIAKEMLESFHFYEKEESEDGSNYSYES